MEQGNSRQQTLLRPQCEITPLTIYFLNLSPVNAGLILLSYVHTFPQTIMRLKIVINMRRMAYAKVTVDLCKSSIKLTHTMRWRKSFDVTKYQ